MSQNPTQKYSAQVLEEVAPRAAKLLNGIGAVPVIRTLMLQVGMTDDEIKEGGKLLLACWGQLPGAQSETDTEEARMQREAVAELDQWDEPNFARFAATLRRHFPSAGDYVFHNLAASTGPAAVAGVATFLTRVEALEKGSDPLRADSKKEDKKAVELLTARGLDKKERSRLGGLVEVALRPTATLAADAGDDGGPRGGARRGAHGIEGLVRGVGRGGAHGGKEARLSDSNRARQPQVAQEERRRGRSRSTVGAPGGRDGWIPRFLCFRHAREASATGKIASAADLERRIGDVQVEAATLHQLAGLEAQQGRVEEAKKLYQLSLDLERRIGGVPGEITTLHNLAVLDYRAGKHAEARAAFVQALERARPIQPATLQAMILNNLAYADFQEGDYPQARTRWTEAKALFEKLQAAARVAAVEDSLALLAATEKTAEAWKAHETVLTGGGVLVIAVVPGGQAAKAGLEAGDILVRHGTKRLDKPQTWQATEKAADPKKKFSLEVLRGAKKLTVRVHGGPLGASGVALPPKLQPKPAAPATPPASKTTAAGGAAPPAVSASGAASAPSSAPAPTSSPSSTAK